MKTPFLFLIIYCCTAGIYGVAQENTSLKIYDFESAAQAMETDDPLMAVFLYTDWCRYCKAMKQTTFNDSLVIQQLNTNYFYIPFDAAYNKRVVLKGEEFNFKPSGKNEGIHEIAIALTAYQKKRTFPTFLIINKNMEILFERTGFMDRLQMIEVLTNFNSLSSN